MWQKLDYDFVLKNHYTTIDLLSSVKDGIKAKYNKEPSLIKQVQEFHIDPGGMICLKNPILESLIDGHKISIRQELILSAIYVWTKYARKDEEGIVKVYLNNFDVLIIPTGLYDKIGAWLASKKSEAYVARASIEEALSEHPNIYVVPMETDGDA